MKPTSRFSGIGVRQMLPSLLSLLLFLSHDISAQSCERSPTLICPPNYYSCGMQLPDTTASGVASSMSFDDDCPEAIITFSDDTTSMDICNGGMMIKRTWRAAYPDSIAPWNFSECTQSIVVADNEAPHIDDCPLDISIMTGSECQELIEWTPPTASDDCGIASFTSNFEPGMMFELGTTIVTYTATDSCGKVTTCSFMVTVNIEGSCCDEAPVIACPEDYIGCVGESIVPSNTGELIVMVADTACGETIVTYRDEVISSGPCDGQVEIRRIWKVTYADNDELADSCTQNILIIDNSTPVISNCPGDTILAEGTTVYTWEPPVVMEDCNYTVSSTHNSGDTFSIGTTRVTITVTDDCGNEDECSFTVTVQEKNSESSITLNCPEDLVLACDKNYNHQAVPKPEVLSDCENCSGDAISGFVYMGEFEGHHYYCSDGKASWPRAKAISANNGGVLAVINSEEENKFITSKLQAEAAWIGLSDRKVEGEFSWVNGAEVSYSNWHPGQPNNYRGYQDYVELLKSGKWNDQNNNRALEFVMELSCYTITQTEGPSNLGDVTSNTTITFTAEDNCGNMTTCSYDIIVEVGSSLDCPGDIEVNTTADWVTIDYPLPELTTCCPSTGSGSSHGREYEGFVYMGFYKGSHYYCSNDKSTWSNAKEVCNARGGHLAIVNNELENSYLASKLRNQVAFIGHSDHSNEGEWKDVRGNSMTYSNWGTDQPNNHNNSQHYAELRPSGFWNDNFNNYKREYIMEMPGGYDLNLLEGLPSGAEFPVGTTEVIYESIDGCGNRDTCSFNVIVNQEKPVSDYCDSYGKSTSQAYIKSAKVNNAIFNSGNNWGYKFHSNYCVDQLRGDEIYLYLTPGFGQYRYTAYWKIWIDHNDDGDFSDEGELVGTAKSFRSVVGNIPIPSHTKTGHIRMRIAMSLNGYPDNSCDLFNKGEVEDFCLNIMGAVGSKVGVLKRVFKPVQFSEVPEDKSDLNVSSVFPNPASQTLYFDLGDKALQSIQLMSSSGQLIEQVEVKAEELDVSKLTAGIYFIQFIDVQGDVVLEKVIIE